jgi:hypothetical protein
MRHVHVTHPVIPATSKYLGFREVVAFSGNRDCKHGVKFALMVEVVGAGQTPPDRAG